MWFYTGDFRGYKNGGLSQVSLATMAIWCFWKMREFAMCNHTCHQYPSNNHKLHYAGIDHHHDGMVIAMFMATIR